MRERQRYFQDGEFIAVVDFTRPNVAYVQLPTELAPHREALVIACQRVNDVADAGIMSGGLIWIQYGGSWATIEDKIAVQLNEELVELGLSREGHLYEITFSAAQRRLVA